MEYRKTHRTHAVNRYGYDLWIWIIWKFAFQFSVDLMLLCQISILFFVSACFHLFSSEKWNFPWHYLSAYVCNLNKSSDDTSCYSFTYHNGANGRHIVILHDNWRTWDNPFQDQYDANHAFLRDFSLNLNQGQNLS